MTNPLPLRDHGAGLSPELRALASVGGMRRPAKVVEHPAFRPYRDRAAFGAPFTVLRVPVVSLNRGAVAMACVCRGTGSTLAMTSREAA
jgi:hypothetical protein